MLNTCHYTAYGSHLKSNYDIYILYGVGWRASCVPFTFFNQILSSLPLSVFSVAPDCNCDVEFLILLTCPNQSSELECVICSIICQSGPNASHWHLVILHILAVLTGTRAITRTASHKWVLDCLLQVWVLRGTLGSSEVHPSMVDSGVY